MKIYAELRGNPKKHGIKSPCDNKTVHVGSLEYVRGFASGYGSPDGDRIVIVEFDPQSAVSVPKDCSYQKIRVCQYTVLEEFTGMLPEFEGHVEEDDEELEFWDIDEDEDGDDVINITTEDLEAEKEDSFDEGREAGIAEANAELDKKLAVVKAEARAEAKAEAKAEIAARLARLSL